MSDKTLVDKIVPYWVWFVLGFSIIAVMFSILNFAMNIIIMVTVKGIYIPSWALVIISLVVAVACITLGYIFEKYDIQNRIQSHQNQNMNPEIQQLSKDMKLIKQQLGINE